MTFDSSTSVQEFVSQLNMEIGMLDTITSGFALMSDWPGEDEVDGFYLFPSSKLCDVIAMWTESLAELGTSVATQTRSIRLTYRKRLWRQSRMGQETDKEAQLIAYQVSGTVPPPSLQPLHPSPPPPTPLADERGTQ